MSGNAEDEKDSPKAVPLDLARNQITTVRTLEGKTPLVMTNHSLRNMRVLTQGVSGAHPSSISGPTIIATNLMSQGVIKPDTSRTQIASIITSNASQAQATGNLSRTTQITLTTAPQNLGTSYHVPRGPAVVANLAAPRSNVSTVRTPMVVSAQSGQTHPFVRPPRTPSPASGTAWLTNSSTGAQIKGTATVLSSPIRGTTVTGKPQLISRSQTQSVPTIRPGTILQNAISIGQSGQIHSFKPGAAGIQALGNAVTITQVLPNRTQAVVYSANTAPQFSPTARLTVPSATQNQRPPQPRTIGQITTTRLTVPVNVSQSGTRLVTPQATVLASGTRISTVPSQQGSTLGSATRIVTSQSNVSLGRVSVAAAPTAVSTANLLGQTRISAVNLHPFVAVANSSQSRSISNQGAKVITPAQGTIHLTPLSTPVKTTSGVVNTTTRTINVPAAIVTQQRQATLVPSYSLGSGTYFYDNNMTSYPVQSRPFGQQQSAFAAIPQTSQSHIRPQANTQIHGIMTNQMRFNSVVVVEPNRSGQQQFQPSHANDQQQQLHHQVQDQVQQSQPPKVVSSPRPSILRKRDHEGSPLKVAKNLIPVLANLPVQCSVSAAQVQSSLVSISPPLRPDSRGNGHSSGGSTTLSATSSPGLAEVNEDSNHVSNNNKEEEESKPPLGMSPRKKPRKQQLTGNDLDENNDDMQFISDNPPKKENEDSDVNHSDEPKDGAPEAGQVAQVRKPASASLLNSYKQNWKATHNHYLRHTDVRPKDERRPTIMDLANQYRVQEKVNGWKVHHLSTQMEDLADQEQTVYDQLTELLKCTESEEGKHFDKDVNRINELIKGNLQRIKIINDGMIEAKTSIMKIFDHKVHVTDIINRCASKRNFKKREKS
nr:histone deacetylase complex subunit SAP130-B [Leptinotarsa decemlineata]